MTLYRMRMKTLLGCVLITLACSRTLFGETITFGEGENTFQLEFVGVGVPGNPPDDDPRISFHTNPNGTSGSVGYRYQIAKFETSCGDADKALASGGFVESGDLPGALSFCDTENAKLPFGSDFWRQRAFVNWLNTSSGFHAAYKFESPRRLLNWSPEDAGYDPSNPVRNSLARYFIATGDEMYKAAFYDPVAEVYYDYATGSNEPPTAVLGGTAPGTAVIQKIGGFADVDNAGGLSPFGTMGQSGNQTEVEESVQGMFLGVDGFQFASFNIFDQAFNGGLRVVAVDPVPEPASISLLAVGLLWLAAFRCRRNHA